MAGCWLADELVLRLRNRAGEASSGVRVDSDRDRDEDRSGEGETTFEHGRSRVLGLGPSQVVDVRPAIGRVGMQATFFLFFPLELVDLVAVRCQSLAIRGWGIGESPCLFELLVVSSSLSSFKMD